MNEEFKNLKEIIELCRLEIDEGNENINATLDYEDLKELFYLLESYQQEKEKNKKLIYRIDNVRNKLELGDYYNCQDAADDLTKLLEEIELSRTKIEEEKRVLEIMQNELKKEIEVLKNKLEIRGKAIDLMAEDISNSDIDEDICRQYTTKEKRCTEGNNADECIDCIKQYYFKKARGE